MGTPVKSSSNTNALLKHLAEVQQLASYFTDDEICALCNVMH